MFCLFALPRASGFDVASTGSVPTSNSPAFVASTAKDDFESFIAFINMMSSVSSLSETLLYNLQRDIVHNLRVTFAAAHLLHDSANYRNRTILHL